MTRQRQPGTLLRNLREWLTERMHSLGLLAADASASLVQRPGHTIGMISGIALAVASASAAMVIADTQQAQVDLRFDLQRSNRVVIQADNVPPAGFPADRVRLAAALDPVAGIGELSIWSQAVQVTRSIASTETAAPLIVADPGGLRASSTSTVAGASAELLPATAASRVAWVGKDLAIALGVTPFDPSRDDEADSQIVIRGVPFSVAGIIESDGPFEYVSGAVVLSRATALETMGPDAENVRLVAHVRPGAAAAIGDYLLQSIDFAGGDMGLRNVTPPDGEKLLANVGGDLREIGVALAGIVGLVGMMGVANTLMLSVHQRLRELGLRSAMGWSRRRIGLSVLTESGVAGMLAGVLGAALGLAVAAAWSWFQGWTLIVAPSLPLLVIAAATTASFLGGIIPATRAASISPLTAMRS